MTSPAATLATERSRLLSCLLYDFLYIKEKKAFQFKPNPNLHNPYSARRHYGCVMPCSDLALSQSEHALYWPLALAI